MKKRSVMTETISPPDVDDLIFGDDIWLTSDR